MFAFDVGPEHAGKTCYLLFYMPPARPFFEIGPISIRIPGGIKVSLLKSNGADVSFGVNLGFLNVRLNAGTQLGLALSVQLGNQYNVGSMPCPAGQRVAFQAESLFGLTADFFQMTNPPLGLFIQPV